MCGEQAHKQIWNNVWYFLFSEKNLILSLYHIIIGLDTDCYLLLALARSTNWGILVFVLYDKIVVRTESKLITLCFCIYVSISCQFFSILSFLFSEPWMIILIWKNENAIGWLFSSLKLVQAPNFYSEHIANSPDKYLNLMWSLSFFSKQILPIYYFS